MYNNLGRLYQFELKKLAKRKLFWITALVSLLCIGFTVTSGLLGTYYVEGEPVESHYQIFKTDQGYRQALTGREIDQKLIQETVDAYMQIPMGVERYTLTQEYQTYARPYSDIFNLIRYWTGMELQDIRNWEVDEDTLYMARSELLEKEWKKIPLTESEKEFWRNKETQMPIPFSYHYHEGYEIAMDSFLTIGVVMLFFCRNMPVQRIFRGTYQKNGPADVEQRKRKNDCLLGKDISRDYDLRGSGYAYVIDNYNSLSEHFWCRGI